MKKNKKSTTLAASVIRGIVTALVLFSLLVSVIGSIWFAESLKSEYAKSTYRMADTAATLIDGDNLLKYVNEGIDEQYHEVKEKLGIFCRKIYVTMIYVIVVDTSDYGRFQSFYNTVYNEVDNTDYDEWEPGHKRDTTNDDYRMKYKAIYEGKSDYETVYRLHITDGKKQHITTLVPVKNSSGEVVGILCMQRPVSSLRNQMLQFLSTIVFIALILSAVTAIIVTKRNKKNFVAPIQKIAEETVRFSSGDMIAGKLGEISHVEEIRNLANSIDKMEEDMIHYIENLTSVTAEKERIGAELDIAKTIQENSIPNIFPAFPERNDFDIFASMTPAKEVGGDFYNFFLVDDDHLALVIADVSGKGVPAALFMMVTNIIISDRTHMGGTPAEILTFTNKNICEHNKADMFVTVWLGILELSTGKMLAANAGHDDPAICRKDGSFEIVKNKRGLVIGAMDGVVYKDFEIQLNKGDKFFLYTDGLPEATNADEKMITIDGMLKILNCHKEKSPMEILNGINESVKQFVGDAPQFDDLTMLCVEYKDEECNNILTLDATVENLRRVLSFVDDLLEKNDCPMKTQMQIDLSVEEIYVNIANYAYGEGVGKAEISFENNNGEITITFRDSGTPYNPLDKADPDITLSAEERDIGGLGIFMTKKNMDRVSYEYKDGQNVLTMKKHL